jgi:hypothetical protein
VIEPTCSARQDHELDHDQALTEGDLERVFAADFEF